MFKLQRLEITGFKSFADYTNLVFTGDGITAVVGPNGCGKSNVADAIAWVLGEQRIKHLRGAEMKDVIFQGSRNRQPSGMAEVVLHLVRDETVENEPDILDIDSTLEEIDDQAVVIEEPVLEVANKAADPTATVAEPNGGEAIPGDGSAPASNQPQTPRTHGKRHWRRHQALEFAPGEAVSVTRRLFRSGESEYLLNDRPCRLRDIQDLFSGTGLSGGHYAIIEQGRIGQILSAKPMDRRTIIEEAAGITKFRVRQRAAEARLESARGNLSRISDIIAEIDRQVNSLRRQAAKAKRYRVSREELRELLRGVYVAEERSLSDLLDQTQLQLEEATRTEAMLASELAQCEADSRTATQGARDNEDRLAQVRAAVAEAALQRDRRIRERSYQEEQIVGLEARRGDLEREIDALNTRLITVEAEWRRLSELEARLTAENNESALSLQNAEEAHAQKLDEVSRAESEIEEARAELLTHTAASERLSEIAHQLESAIERLAQQAEGLAHEGERAARAHDDRAIEAERLSGEIATARERLAKLVAERETALLAVVEGHERVSDTDAELTRVRDEHSRTHHRLESLRELDQRRANCSSTVQEIFSANAVEDFHFIGTLADAIQVEARWERAVEGILGPSLQTVLVPTPEDAARASMWLRANNAGRAAFLVTGFHGASGEAEVDTYRSWEVVESRAYEYAPVGIDGPRVGDILRAPAELLLVLERTLTEKMNARIVDSIDDALALSLATGDMFVTTEGDWVAGGQFVNAGNARAIEESAGLLSSKRELRELEAAAEDFAGQLEGAKQQVSEARARLVDLEETVVLLNEVIGREERDAMGRELTANGLKQDIERAIRHVRVVADDAARLATEQQELADRRLKALAEAAAAEAARLAAMERVAQASSRWLAARREAESENELLNEQRAVAAAAAERRRSTSTELRRLQSASADLKSRLERHAREIEEIATRIEQLHQSIGEIDALAATVDQERALEAQQIAAATAQLNDARDRADAVAAELAEVNRRAASSRDARSAIEVQRAEGHARLSYVREACTAELGQNLADLAAEHPIDEGFDLEAGRARVEELRARIEGFGAVNMMALEELTESEQRLLFLTAQREDIRQGIDSTEEALREIKRRSRERFRAAFEQINLNFGELFKELFGGGRGEMSLIDADDELESGIDVIAQPPGKRLQNVLLLSGGEKAMAALALVLGIFHYRPSPFCLLDEVDAPLDEANVGRFTTKVVQMSANTQFIVITHNKRTMEMARALYGVTMEEVGVSKLVSVKFE